jgi:hypothetical protein
MLELLLACQRIRHFTKRVDKQGFVGEIHMSLTNDCTNIKLPYCEQRNERTYKKRQEYWKDGYKLYLHKETWDYDFK